jgi:hypothetical protein
MNYQFYNYSDHNKLVDYTEVDCLNLPIELKVKLKKTWRRKNFHPHYDRRQFWSLCRTFKWGFYKYVILQYRDFYVAMPKNECYKINGGCLIYREIWNED